MFNINGEWWQVLLVSPNHPKLQRADGSFTIGSCDDITKTIYVNDMLNKQLMRKVLCHEITHAAMFSYNILLTLDQEELLADLIATYGSEIENVTNRVFSKISKGNWY